MAYPRAAGHPNYSGSTDGFYIPDMWAPDIQVRLYQTLVAKDITNTKYEGTFKKQGDQVNIVTYPDITIGNYVKGQILDVQTPTSTPTSMVIDKGKYYNLLVDDVDEVQSAYDLKSNFTDTAGKQLQIAIDQDVLQNTYSDASSDNVGTTAGVESSEYNMGAPTTPVVLTAENILETIIDMASVLDEQNVPEEERWIVLPPLFYNLLKKSDIKDVSMMGDTISTLRTTAVGSVIGMTIHKSNNLYSVTDGSTGNTCFYVLCGHPMAVSFAMQLQKTEALRSTETIGDLLRGFEIYGYKVVKPEAFLYLYAEKG